jgi:hypothetical protein
MFVKIAFTASLADLERNALCYTLRISPLTPKLNPSAQSCMTRFFARDFAS